MTFEKFKEEFEACEKRLPISQRFTSILDDIRESMMGPSYKSENCKLCAGITPERVKYAYFHNKYSLYIRKDVYDNLLVNFSTHDKTEIIVYCFCKYFMLSDYGIERVIITTSTFIEDYITKESEDFERNDLLMSEETGEVFSSNISRLMIGCIPLFAPIN